MTDTQPQTLLPSAPLSWRFRLGAAIAVVAIVLTGAATIDRLIRRHEAEVIRQLEVIARMKGDQVEQWLGERRRDAQQMTTANAMNQAMRNWLRNGDAASRSTVVEQLDAVRHVMGYESVFMVNGERPLLEGSGVPRPIGPLLRQAVAQAVSTGEVVFTDLYTESVDGVERIHLDFVAPLAGDTPLAVVMRMNEAAFLFPYLQDMPTRKASAETLLFRRDGDSVLFLNELRHRADSALKLRVPLADHLTLAAQVASGRVTPGQTVFGVDYRGVRAIGVARKVAGTSWYLIAKIDHAELMAETRKDLFWIVLTFVLAALVALAAAALLRQRRIVLWTNTQQRQQAERLRLQQVIERQHEERAALASHYATLIEKARDIVLLMDVEGRIVDANEAAQAAYGCSVDELRHMTVRDLRTPESLRDFERQWAASDAPDGALFEAVHRRRDCSTFPVEISSRTVKVEDKVYRQNFVRDISERKQAELMLSRVNRALRTISECNQLLVRASDENSLLNGVCHLLVEQGGYCTSWVGFAEYDGTVRPVAHAGFEQTDLDAISMTWADAACAQCPTGIAVRNGQHVIARHMAADPPCGLWEAAARQRGSAASIALPLTRHPYGCFGALSVYAADGDAFDEAEVVLLTELADDLAFGITALRTRQAHDEAEAALRESEARLRLLGDNLPDSYVYQYVHRPDGLPRFIYLSAGVERLHGLQVDDVLHDAGTLHRQIDAAQWTALAAAERQSLREETDFRMELRIRHVDGYWRWLQMRSRPRCTADGQVVWDGVATDITERKKTEETLRQERDFSNKSLDSLPGVFYCYDEELKFRRWNKNFETVTGYTGEEIARMSPLDFFAGAEKGLLAERIQKVFDEGGSDAEADFVSKDGTRTPY